jgi:hypothetical protein
MLKFTVSIFSWRCRWSSSLRHQAYEPGTLGTLITWCRQRQKRVISEQRAPSPLLYAWPCNPVLSAWRRQVVRYPHPPRAVLDVCITNRWTRPAWRHREQSSVSSPECCGNNCVAYIQTWLSLHWFTFCTQLSSVSSLAWRNWLYSSRLGSRPSCSSAVHVASYK